MSFPLGLAFCTLPWYASFGLLNGKKMLPEDIDWKNPALYPWFGNFDFRYILLTSNSSHLQHLQMDREPWKGSLFLGTDTNDITCIWFFYQAVISALYLKALCKISLSVESRLSQISDGNSKPTLLGDILETYNNIKKVITKGKGTPTSVKRYRRELRGTRVTRTLCCPLIQMPCNRRHTTSLESVYWHNTKLCAITST